LRVFGLRDNPLQSASGARTVASVRCFDAPVAGAIFRK
jgi:hypothetical protein